MSFYDAFKDAISLAQKADNIELYRQLLDLSAQALDLQAEVAKLKEENSKLISELSTKKNIVRHQSAYITLSDDNKNIPYCAICYGKSGTFIQLTNYDGDTFYCCGCGQYLDK